MRIGFISDIHFDINWKQDLLHALGRMAKEEGLDYLVVGGDTANGAWAELEFYKALAEELPCQLRIIAGNHGQYQKNYGRKEGPAIRRAAEDDYRKITYHPEWSLLLHPIVTKHWFITGVCGWYDYSFHRKFPQMNLKRCGKKKLAVVRWPDSLYIDGRKPDPSRDRQKVEESLEVLEKALDTPQCRGRKICVVTHVLPTRDLVRDRKIPLYAKGVNFLGSERYREFFEKNGVRLSISGHSHMRMALRRKNIDYVNVSLGYHYQWKYKQSPDLELKDALFVVED